MSVSLGASRPANKPKLLDQVRNAIRVKHYSIRTEEACVDWIRRFILFHNKRHPAEMSEAEVAQFLTHLARDVNVAASTQNQALSALLFLTRKPSNTRSAGSSKSNARKSHKKCRWFYRATRSNKSSRISKVCRRSWPVFFTEAGCA